MKHMMGQFAGETQVEYSTEPRHGRVVIPIHQAKSSLSKLVKRAAAGETIYIGAYGREEAAIVSVGSVRKKKPVAEAFGCMRERLELPDGWDGPLPDDIIDSFYSMRGLEDFEAK